MNERRSARVMTARQSQNTVRCDTHARAPVDNNSDSNIIGMESDGRCFKRQRTGGDHAAGRPAVTHTAANVTDRHHKQLGPLFQFPSSVASSGEYSDYFASTAKTLLNDVVLAVETAQSPKSQLFRILEIEFYRHDALHPDPYTHTHRQQQTAGRWYFHAAGSGEDSYRGGSYKGLDIAFGGCEGEFGGILIRTLQRIATDGTPTVVTCGPSLVVDALLSAAGVSCIREFVLAADRRLSVDSVDVSTQSEVPSHLRDDATTVRAHTSSALRGAEPSLSMRLRWARDAGVKIPTLAPLATPRIGLNVRTKATGHLYVARRYRFLVRPDVVSKGRPHLVASLRSRGLTAADIDAVLAGREMACSAVMSNHGSEVQKDSRGDSLDSEHEGPIGTTRRRARVVKKDTPVISECDGAGDVPANTGAVVGPVSISKSVAALVAAYDRAKHTRMRWETWASHKSLGAADVCMLTAAIDARDGP